MTSVPVSRDVWARQMPNFVARRIHAHASGANSALAAFAINGRFLSQRVTGVQRYGREILYAMDRLATERGFEFELLLPKGVAALSGLTACRQRTFGIATGHIWEQCVLPTYRQPLLNLCNTAPVLSRNGVLCIHDANVFEVPESYTPAFRRFYATLHPLAVRTGARIATVSRDAAVRLSGHLRVDASAIVVASDGHEHALRWQPENATVRPGSRPFLLLIGSLAKHKNISRVLELACAIDERGLDILVVGAASSVFAATDCARPANVRYLGSVTDDDLALLLKRAFCLAFPSRSEGFGLPVLEAMVWECPVIASRSCSLPEIGGDACLYAAASDGSAWLEQIDRLRGSPGLADALRAKGRARVGQFSWERSAAAYLDILT